MTKAKIKLRYGAPIAGPFLYYYDVKKGRNVDSSEMYAGLFSTKPMISYLAIFGGIRLVEYLMK